MPSIKTKTPLLGGSYYHLFNRGINRGKIFDTTSNYHFFLTLIERYLIEYMDILAYCLLPNHFHLVVKIKDAIETGAVSKQKIQPRSIVTNEEQIGKLASKQLGRLFTSYAMAINKQENRVSNLFDPKFKRLEIDQHEYLEYLIFYTHYNPDKHGITTNFKTYLFSSYNALSGLKQTKLNRKLVWEIFGGHEDFLDFHKGVHNEVKQIIIE
ncbi:hypothetical protein [Draconibacterium orientale]|uniref:hypothetical protein n=1 Tax=Draconibacterium orientale TaxID=1168034 RepID=UPI002ABE781B|nr:hypothetical protein [Draconibacterium orientale]